jgi:hypothetical protein
VSDTYELLNKPQRKKHKAPGKRHTLGRYNTSATRIERKGDKPLRRGQTDSTKICSEKATFIEDCQKTNLNATWRRFLTCLDTSVFSSPVFRQPAHQFQELLAAAPRPGSGSAARGSATTSSRTMISILAPAFSLPGAPTPERVCVLTDRQFQWHKLYAGVQNESTDLPGTC